MRRGLLSESVSMFQFQSVYVSVGMCIWGVRSVTVRCPPLCALLRLSADTLMWLNAVPVRCAIWLVHISSRLIFSNRRNVARSFLFGFSDSDRVAVHRAQKLRYIYIAAPTTQTHSRGAGAHARNGVEKLEKEARCSSQAFQFFPNLMFGLWSSPLRWSGKILIW